MILYCSSFFFFLMGLFTRPCPQHNLRQIHSSMFPFCKEQPYASHKTLFWRILMITLPRATVFAVALNGTSERMKRSIWEGFSLIHHTCTLLCSWTWEKKATLLTLFCGSSSVRFVSIKVTVLCTTLCKILILIRLNEISFPFTDMLFYFMD